MLWLQKISFKTETFSLIKKGARKTTQWLKALPVSNHLYLLF